MAQQASGAKAHLDTPHGSVGLRGGRLRGDGHRGGITGHQSDGSDAADGAKGAPPGAAGATAAPAKWSLGARHAPRATVGRAGRWPQQPFPRAPAWPLVCDRQFWGPIAAVTWSPLLALFSRVPRRRSKGRTEWWFLAEGWFDIHGERGEI